MLEKIEHFVSLPNAECTLRVMKMRSMKGSWPSSSATTTWTTCRNTLARGECLTKARHNPCSPNSKRRRRRWKCHLYSGRSPLAASPQTHCCNLGMCAGRHCRQWRSGAECTLPNWNSCAAHTSIKTRNTRNGKYTSSAWRLRSKPTSQWQNCLNATDTSNLSKCTCRKRWLRKLASIKQ